MAVSDTDAVSIIIVAHNSLPALTACLQALPAAAGGLLWQLIVVDNASSDQSPDIVARTVPDALILRNARNRGFAAACNQGAMQATGGWLLFLNPDVILDAGSIRVLIAALKDRPKAGLATMRLRYADGSFQANCRQFPTVGNLLFSRGSVVSRLLRLKRSSNYTFPDFDDPTEVPAVSATAMAIRREQFIALQGFDERFFMFMEDTDLSRRVRDAGYINLFVPQAGAVHSWGQGSSRGKIPRAWHHHLSVWRYFRKFDANSFSFLLLPAILFVNLVLAALLPSRRK